MAQQITIDVEILYQKTGAAKLARLQEYELKVMDMAGISETCPHPAR